MLNRFTDTLAVKSGNNFCDVVSDVLAGRIVAFVDNGDDFSDALANLSFGRQIIEVFKKSPDFGVGKIFVSWEILFFVT